MSARRALGPRTLAVCLGVGLIALVGITGTHRVSRVYPLSPWDAAATVEAVRVLRGMPLHEDAASGHAPLVYGFAYPYASALSLLAAGENNYAVRALTLLSAFAIWIALTWLARPRRLDGWHVLIFGMLVAVELRDGFYAFVARPDMLGGALALLAVCLFARGHAQRSWAWLAGGVLALLLASSIKQSLLVFCVVPVFVIFDRSWSLRKRVLYAVLPTAAVVGYLLVIRLGFPLTFHYLTIHKGYRIPTDQLLRRTFEALRESLLFLALLLLWLRSGRSPTRAQSWALATLAVVSPFCLLAHAKIGGAANSMLPVYFAMTFLAATFLGDQADFGALRAPAGLREALIAYGMLAFVGWASVPDLVTNLSLWTHADPRQALYANVVTAVSELRGCVISPEDPTVAYFGAGQLGRSLVSELDVRPTTLGEWPAQIPVEVARDFSACNHVVDVLAQPQLSSDDLYRWGFAPCGRQGAEYAIWSKPSDCAPRVDPRHAGPRLRQ